MNIQSLRVDQIQNAPRRTDNKLWIAPELLLLTFNILSAINGQRLDSRSLA